MNRELTITVTQDDINLGEKGKCNSCPIALAAQRALHTDAVTVGSAAIFGKMTEQGEFEDIYELPPEARDFIVTFDDPFREYEMEPFTFVATLMVYLS